MSKWIDADALKYYGNHLDDEYEAMYHDAQWVYRFQIDSAPSIDIVRCQDCRHRYMDADLQVWTCTYGLMIKPDGFCNYGEVRDE